MATADLTGVSMNFVDTVEKASEFLRWLSERRPHDVIAVDTETGELPGNDRKHAFSPWHGRLRLVQVGDGMTGWAIPWERWNGVFHEAMEKYQGEIICHNVAFENKWFEVQSDFRIPWHRTHDTMIMSQIINPLQSAALKSLTKRYVDGRAAGLQQLLDMEMVDNGWTWGTIPVNNKKYWCVPLDTEILTRQGWKKHSELLPGDQTLGRTPDSTELVWTTITKRQVFPDAELVRVGNSRWSTECTPEHRWLYERPINQYVGKDSGKSKYKFSGYGNPGIEPLSEIQKHRSSRLILTGTANDGDSLLTPNEARVIAWLQTDGHITWQRPRSSPNAAIFQSEDKYAAEVRSLLKLVSAYVSERDKGINEATRNVNKSFYVKSSYVTALWEKAGLHDINASQFVMSLSKEARKAWLETVDMADGDRRSKRRTGGRKIVKKAPGQLHDAIVLAAYMEGNLVRGYTNNQGEGVITFGSEKRPTFQKTMPVSAGTADVWCPTTELGTWTARDRDGRVFVTGNCYGVLDTILTVRLYEKLREEIKPYQAVYDMEMAVRRVCSKMEHNGARVDIEYSRAQHERLGMHAQSVRDWVKDAYDINAGSPLQLTSTFVDRLGGEVSEFTPGGQPKMDKTQLAKFVIQGGEGSQLAQLAEQVLAMRKSAKLADTYFANFINGNIDGVMHPEIRTLGARTSRMSITSPALQTLPKRDQIVRKAFIPRNEGEVLVSADLEQVEFRMMAGLSRDPALVNLFQECDASGEDAFTRIGQEVYADPSMVKSDSRRALMKTYIYGCHDIMTKIFTDRGWLSNEEVKVGDKTIGLNLETGKSEWTEVTGVHNFPKGELFRFGNKHRSFLCTADHRWATTGGRPGNPRREAKTDIRHAHDIAGSERALVLAAPFAGEGTLDVSEDEASLIGWVLTDGSLSRSTLADQTAWAPSQGNGAKRHVKALVTQTKPANLGTISDLLGRLGQTKAPHIVEKTGQHIWNLSSPFSRDLFDRAGIESKLEFDPWELALGLSPVARQSMLAAINLGDGKSRKQPVITQSADSLVAVLVEALAFFLGKYTSSRLIKPDGKGWQKKDVVIKTVGKGTMTCQKMTLEPHSTAPVWCVTTGLGTWTASQDDNKTGPFITGNTMYGAGIATSAVNAGVPESRMKEVAAAFNSSYPGVKGFMQQVEHTGMTRLRSDGEAYVKTKLGRRLPADEGRVYTLVNYCLAPDTPILGSDLVHKPASKVAVGDRLVAFDEYPEDQLDKNGKQHGVRRMRTAVVEEVSTVRKTTVRVTVADGRTVDCSDDHLWLVRTKARKKGQKATQWVPASALQTGDKLFSAGTPWEEDMSKGAGWLAGMYDGEGCLGTRSEGRQSTQLMFAQNAGPVMNRFVAEMTLRDFPFTYKDRHPSNSSPCQTVHSYGMFPLMKILGTLQPTRFQSRFESLYEGAALTGGTTDFQEVVSVEPIGEAELVSIQTSTRTLIANGLLSHNCIQGGAAEVFKQDMLRADSAGLGEYLVVPVHDELVMSVPRAEAEEAGRELQKCMTTTEGWPVALLAGAPEVGRRWGGMKDIDSPEGQAILAEPAEKEKS